MTSAGSGSDWFSGAAAAAMGMGILTFALFPLAIPLLLLTIAALLPLALPLIVLAGIAAILAGARLTIRAAGRLLRQPGRAQGRAATPWTASGRREHCLD